MSALFILLRLLPFSPSTLLYSLGTRERSGNGRYGDVVMTRVEGREVDGGRHGGASLQSVHFLYIPKNPDSYGNRSINGQISSDYFQRIPKDSLKTKILGNFWQASEFFADSTIFQYFQISSNHFLQFQCRF